MSRKYKSIYTVVYVTEEIEPTDVDIGDNTNIQHQVRGRLLINELWLEFNNILDHSPVDHRAGGDARSMDPPDYDPIL